jgi:hypothetical protein
MICVFNIVPKNTGFGNIKNLIFVASGNLKKEGP